MASLFQLFDQFVRQFGGQPWLSPALGAAGAVLAFLVLFTTRDILLRTHSLIAQLLCILLVALLPGVGFLLYLLVRPARTLHQRYTDALVRELHAHVFQGNEGTDEEELIEVEHVEVVAEEEVPSTDKEKSESRSQKTERTKK